MGENGIDPTNQVVVVLRSLYAKSRHCACTNQREGFEMEWKRKLEVNKEGLFSSPNGRKIEAISGSRSQ